MTDGAPRSPVAKLAAIQQIGRELKSEGGIAGTNHSQPRECTTSFVDQPWQWCKSCLMLEAADAIAKLAAQPSPSAVTLAELLKELKGRKEALFYGRAEAGPWTNDMERAGRCNEVDHWIELIGERVAALASDRPAPPVTEETTSEEQS